jgi:Polyketide cyclase / dehydrase and lipid transport
MTRAVYSTVIDVPIGEMWVAIRDFGNYSLWVTGAGTHTMEAGRTSDAVGAARVIDLGDRRIVQRLVEFSDRQHRYRYSFEQGAPTEVSGYEGCVSLQSITATDGTFVTWSADFETAPDRRQEWQATFAGWFSGWLTHLQEFLRTPLRTEELD